MNKATLISTINGFLTAVITQLKHRNSMLEIINTLFQTTYVLSNTPAPNQFTYNLKFKKIGNIVHVSGFVKNDFSTMQGSTIVATIGNSLYNCKTANDVILNVTGTTSLQNGLLSVAENNLFLITNIGIGNTIIINGHYQTND